MAWPSAYSGWASESTDAAKLSMLNLFIGDVANAIGPEINAGGGKSRSTNALMQMYETLLRQRESLEARAGVTGMRIAYADLRDP